VSNYVTTNIRLPEEDYLRLKEEAAKKRKSLSAIIREKVSKNKKPSREEYRKILLTPTPWFTDKDYEDYKKIRKEWKDRSEIYDR
jgi:hypothetical protein